MDKNTTPNTGMAFYHPDGFVPAWKQASAFANGGAKSGHKGRIATLPDIISARLSETGTRNSAWGHYFTTTSAEYCGVGKDGKRKIIVAHGVGPMATLDGIQKAYSHEYKDTERNRRGGRISREDFLKLEAGEFGKVAVVDYDELVARYEYPFLEVLTLSKALAEPLMEARLGPRWREYLKRHAREARAFFKEEGVAAPDAEAHQDPYLIQMEDASNCSYQYAKVAEDQAIAHLLSIGSLSQLSHSPGRGRYRTSLVCDVSCHEWWNGVRLAAVQIDASLKSIHPGVTSLRDLMYRHWQHLIKPVTEQPEALGMRVLTKVDGKWFTQYPKQGERMDTHEAEFPITSIVEVEGGPATFTTTEGGGFFFKYGIKEVERIAPCGANAYYLPGEVCRGGDGFITGIQFFRVEVDTSRRMPRQADVQNNFELLMQLLEMDKKAK